MMLTAARPIPRISTGAAGLDDILHGGLPKNRIYLLEGDPGTGKTTLAIQFVMSGIRSGGKALYVSMSETADELRQTSESHGWDISALPIFECVPVEANLSPDNQYTFFHPEEVELGETIHTIVTKIEEAQPTHLVIDSLAELRLLAQDPRRYRRQVLALKNYFAGKKITVLLLDDRTSQHQEKQLHSVVHGVISLQRMPREYGKNRRRLEISKVRGSAYIDGFHDYQIKHGGVTVYPRMQSEGDFAEFNRERLACGIQNMDNLLGGGLDRGSSSLFLGPAGSGKSTLAVKFALASVNLGQPAAIYAFDEGTPQLLERSKGLGLPLLEALNEGRITVQQIDPAEMSPDEFAWTVRQAVERDGVRVVVIDSLNGYLTAMPEEQFLNLQMHELLTYLNQHGVVTILILAQHGPLGQAPTTVDLSYLADTIVLLRFFEFGGEIRRAVSVVKKRGTNHERTIREFEIGPPVGIDVGQPLTNFRGILTGNPEYTGDRESLLNVEHGADDRS